jgi:hypothetical protein
VAHSARSSTTISSAAGEARGVGELLAVVGDVQPETHGRRDLSELVSDVPGAQQVQPRRGSIGSMNTSIWPPQISPVSSARSSFSS